MERVIYRAGPIVSGRMVRFLPGYAREMKVQQPVLAVVFAAAGVTRMIARLVTAVLRAGSGGGARRWRDLKKAPEFLVTPLRIRDATGRLCEVELHGHLPQSALQRDDQVVLYVRAQRDPELPSRVEKIVNVTTGQLLTPHTPTMWSHLGPALVLQAMAGLAALGAVAAVAAVG
jgi:hypothetical protein